MDTEFWKVLFDKLPAIISAIGVIIVGRWAYKSKNQSETNATTLATVEKKVDGMSHDLVAATAGQNRAEGQLQERDAERAHQSEQDPKSVVPVNGDADDPLKVQLVKDKK